MRFRRDWLSLAVFGGMLLFAAYSPVHSEEDGPPVNGTFVDNNALPPAESLGDLVEQAIQVTSKRRLTAGMHTPWQIVHGILALRWDFMLLAGKGREEVNAIEWIASGPLYDGM